MASEIKVDTISEKTSANGVSIDGLKIKDVTSGSVMSKPVLQIVTGTTTTDTGALATTSFTDTNLSGSITPTSTSSKILVVVSQTLQYQRSGGGEMGGYLNIMRDTTEVGEWFWKGDGGSYEGPRVHTFSYTDSPSSTSSLTYKTQIKGFTTDNSASVRANQQTTGSESPSSIHLIEIAG